MPRGIHRRQFLQGGLGSLAAATAWRPGWAAMSPPRWQNWSGLLQADPAWQVYPQSLAELRTVIRHAPGPIRPVGASHSFAPLCPTSGCQVHLDNMRGLVAVNPELQRARLRAGTTVRELGPLLAAHGMALSNQGDVDPQTLAGATGTSTHGTGLTQGSFSSMVTAAQVLTAQGELIEINANDHPDWLPAVSCHLGVLGIVTELELQLRPSYRLEEVIEVAPLQEVLADLPSLLRDNRHFEFFVFPYSDRVLVKRLNETTAAVTPKPRVEIPEDRIFSLLTELGHGVRPLDGPLQQLLTAVLPDSRRVAPSYQIFPSARSTRFNEMEYELPMEQGAEVLLQVIDAIRRRDLNVMFPLEVRSVAADAGWISPFYRRTAMAISVHQWAQADHRPLFETVEPLLQQHGGRPHWGKMHTLKARDFAQRYPRFEDFARLRAELDPGGKLLTPPLQEMLVLN